jgi:chitinase
MLTLNLSSCTSPGCPFSDAGVAGTCTGEPGILSFDEISTIRSLYNLQTVYDEGAGVNYFAFAQNQWVSYDDSTTLRQKVQYANKNGLLGIFIWALDLDDLNHDALDAVLIDRGGLGAFKQQNGVGLIDYTNYTQGTGTCFLGTCSANPSCPFPYTIVGHQVRCDQQGTYRQVCCPSTDAPDPAICEWRGG